jgi:hypothetical protein
MPLLVQEVDALLPIIRRPHWTSWSVENSNPNVSIGTRELDGQGHVFIVNTTSRDQQVTLTVEDLPYLPATAVDVFSNLEVGSFEGKSITVTVPAIGTGSGTMVLGITESAPSSYILASHTLSILDVNESPTVALIGTVASLSERTDTSNAVRVAEITVDDDALGTNSISLTGAGAASFEIIGNELRLKAGTLLDFGTQSVYEVVVQVDDLAVGGSPDDTASFTLDVTEFSGGVASSGLDFSEALGLKADATDDSASRAPSSSTLPVPPLDAEFAATPDRGRAEDSRETEPERKLSMVNALDELFSSLDDLGVAPFVFK